MSCRWEESDSEQWQVLQLSRDLSIQNRKHSAVEKEKAHAEGMYGILCTLYDLYKKQILQKKKFFLVSQLISQK